MTPAGRRTREDPVVDIPAILSRIPMFAELEKDELASVAEHVTPFAAQPGQEKA